MHGSRMKILLFGKDGQVGSKLRQALLPLGDVLSMGRKDLPLENLSELADFVKLHKPDIIVNAAAHTAVDKAENEWNLALRVNAHAVEVLASYAQLSGALLVQYSTNYVFDGEKNSSYIETEETKPLNNYV
jgi:dTDP-4-dehydrorhamnose reductase